MNWKFWKKKSTAFDTFAKTSTVNNLINADFNYEEERRAELKWWQDLRKHRYAVRTTPPSRDDMARRDDRYRTLLLKEIAMQLSAINTKGEYPNALTKQLARLENIEKTIYSQPLPDWNNDD